MAGEDDPIEAVGRLGARLILQQALEDEVTEFLGRRRYERAGETVSHRNGHERRTVKTTSGAIELERPRVRNASKLGFESRVLGKGVTRTHAWSRWYQRLLAGSVHPRRGGCLEEVFEEPIASKSTVSRICEDTRERYRQWCRRRLEQHDIVYCFLDAIYLKLRPDDTPAEGVLVCWGVTLEGRKVLLGLALGSRESYDGWLAFGRDMIARGLRAPALVIADGAPGIWKAVRELWPRRWSSAAPSTHFGTSPASSPSATTRRSRRAGGKHSTRPAPRARPRRICRASSPTTRRPTPRRWPSSNGPARARHPPTVPVRASQADPDHESPGEDVRGGPPANEGDRPVPRRDIRPLTDLGRAGALIPRLARREDEPQDRRRDRAATPPTTRHHDNPTSHDEHRGGDRRITSPSSGATPEQIHPGNETRPRSLSVAPCCYPTRSTVLPRSARCSASRKP